MSEQPDTESPTSPLAGPLGKVRAVWEAMSRPGRILVLTTIAAVAVLGAWLSFGADLREYGVLYAQLEQEDAAKIAEKLKELKADYRLTGNGTTIEVPEEQVHELRLTLASEGLPRGGSVGFESFENLRLGATEFEQQVTYKRAMEGELSRTIATVGAIQSARVHLVLPEKSVFATRSEPASASVVIKMRGGGTLGKGEVNGIVHLVASAVSGLDPERVALVTSEGHMLHRPKKPGDPQDELAVVDPEQLAQARALEAGLEQRAQSMLEQVIGEGKANVKVSAELDLARIERTEDRYEPARTALRSEEQLVEQTNVREGDVAGVPGAESNLPGDAEIEEGGEPQGVVRKQHTRNWEIDHVAERKITTSGTIKRLTVAVVVDGIPGEGEEATPTPRPQEELDKLGALVASAVGIDKSRGDIMTIESIPFVPPAPLDEDLIEEPAPLVPASVMRFWPVAAGALALILFFVALGAIRSVRRAGARLADEREMKQLEAAEGPIAQLAPPRPVLSDREEAIRRAQTDPATAAMVMRHWLGMGEDKKAA